MGSSIPIKSIINALRELTLTTDARAQCLLRAEKPDQDWGEPQTWECNHCHFYFEKKGIKVDHIIPVGPPKEDWTGYITRLFCDESNLQVLCNYCHDEKTKIDVARMKAND